MESALPWTEPTIKLSPGFVEASWSRGRGWDEVEGVRGLMVVTPIPYLGYQVENCLTLNFKGHIIFVDKT